MDFTRVSQELPNGMKGIGGFAVLLVDPHTGFFLGDKLDRRSEHGRFVTGLITPSSLAADAWVWGHYFDADQMVVALHDLVDRIARGEQYPAADWSEFLGQTAYVEPEDYNPDRHLSNDDAPADGADFAGDL